MIERLDGGDKPARLSFWDSFSEDGNYVDDAKENASNKSSASEKSKKEEYKDEHSKWVFSCCVT